MKTIVHNASAKVECPDALRSESNVWTHEVKRMTCPTCKP